MLPFSVEDSKKSDDFSNSSGILSMLKKRISEVIFSFNCSLTFLVCLITRIDFPYRVLLVAVSSLSTLVTFLLPMPSALPGQKVFHLVVFPLIISGLVYIGLEFKAPGFHHLSTSGFITKTLDLTTNSMKEVQESMSVVIPARNEDDDLLMKTIISIFDETPDHLLHEIVVVDDQSDIPIESVVDRDLPRDYQREKVKVVRLEERQGLTNAKTIGATFASASHILFLDGHCKLMPGYAEKLMERSRDNPNAIIVPQVLDVDAATFEFKNQDGGKKMMFEWTFEFSWFDQDKNDDRVPVSSGGLLLMTRSAFLNGKYDRGMLEWGGENIEQSLRAWMCNSKVIVEREAKIGHVFNRKLRPGRVNVSTVQKNQARAAFVWLDDWIKYFEAKHKGGANFLPDLGPHIDERLELRHRLGCGKFDVFVDEFREIFDQRNLFADFEYSIQDRVSGLCLSGHTQATKGRWKDKEASLRWEHCRMYETQQRFGSAVKNTRLRSVRFERCFEVKNNEIILYACDLGTNKPAQNFVFDEASGLIKVGAKCIAPPNPQDIKASINSKLALVDCSSVGVGMRKMYLGI
jgi:polypeptide N-acetylgalactosaminyltransferase